MSKMLESILTQYENFNVLIGIGVFFTYAVADALYAYYTLSVAEYHPFKAATTGSLIHLLLALGVLSYVENYLYIIPIALGSWVGTYILVKKSIR